ncbi:hypothetical protein [Clostridium sp.]|jgi:hypothetical protein|uniref:hypothetical protein n=1 Tax=Clostridium sp. TaxID=1506 RepID=UPI0025C04B90|nr:hypothetical protein [Clostridium sp.]MCI9069109.1 hypothetical protein [Clostridium sp.]
MDTEKAKVIDINDYRESKLDNEDLKEDNNRSLSDSFYENLREEKRKEKGLLWD